MCYPDVAEHLTSHPDIKHVLFIGSKPVAHKVAEAAAKVLTKENLSHSRVLRNSLWN